MTPELLFLDEPTTGFDPAARRDAWQLVRSLRDSGTTILLTTHYMEEAQALADRVAVLSDGQVVAQGTLATSAAGPPPRPRSVSCSRSDAWPWTSRPGPAAGRGDCGARGGAGTR